MEYAFIPEELHDQYDPINKKLVVGVKR